MTAARVCAGKVLCEKHFSASGARLSDLRDSAPHFGKGIEVSHGFPESLQKVSTSAASSGGFQKVSRLFPTATLPNGSNSRFNCSSDRYWNIKELPGMMLPFRRYPLCRKFIAVPGKNAGRPAFSRRRSTARHSDQFAAVRALNPRHSVERKSPRPCCPIAIVNSVQNQPARFP
jgi:hypothetical protein